MDEQKKLGVTSGRLAVDAYRLAHAQLHSTGWHKGISEEHTQLLVKLVDDLEKQGFTSTQTEFEPKKTEVMAKFWDNSDLLNIQELGFASKENFEAKATEADFIALEGMWQ